MNDREKTEASEREAPAEQQGGVNGNRAPDAANEAGPAPEEAVAEEPGTREAELEAELEATKDRLLRALAETENLRRRSERELEDARRYAITGFAREVLDVADNLSRALANVPPKAREKLDLVKTLADGVEMTEKSLHGIFERHRISKVEPAPGEKFDHNRHQAMFEVETSEHPPGTVAQVLQPGYMLAERLLRPAMVGVAKAPSRPGPGDEGAGQGRNEDPDGPRSGERVDTTA